MRVLITGATGFAGGHLAARLAGEGGHELHGLSRLGRWPGPAPAPVTLHPCDLTRAEGLAELLGELAPDRVYHLAGYASPGKSFKEPGAAWSQNLEATRRLFDALARWGGRARVLYVSTGLVYGDAPDGQTRLTEAAELRPASPYAASKAAAEMLAYQVTRSPGLDVVRVRPFNHVGPGQSAEYALPSFARQIVAIERGLRPPLLETGDLSACRDLTDVRDMVDAYVRLMELGESGQVYNAAAGRSWRIADALQTMLDVAGVRAEVRQTADPGRKGDTAVAVADASRLRGLTGWAPARALEQTVRDILDWWRRGPA